MTRWSTPWRRGKERPRRPQGEEYEIAKEHERRRERDRYAWSLIEKAGRRQYPVLKDPFE